MPPKDKRVAVKPRDTAKMPRNPAEDALYRLTLAGDLFKEQVLARLEPTDRGMLRLTSKALRLTMYIDEHLDRKLEVSRFIGSEKSFDWALKNYLGLIDSNGADICKYAARNGHLELLKMIKHKADIREMRPFGTHPVYYNWKWACETTHLDVLEWVYRSTIPAKEVDDCWKQLWKANAETLEVLPWICDTFPQINNYIRSSSSYPWRAAEKGHLELLKWLIESLGRPMKPILCAKAATGGHLEVLKWLRGKGCNWTEKVLENATDNANLHIMRYAIENGCKWNPEWTLHDLENIDDQEKSLAASRHHRKVQTGTVHENFGEDFQWIIQRAHQQIADDKLAAEEKQRRKDEKERRAAQKRKAD